MKVYVNYMIEIDDREGDQSLAVLHTAEDAINGHRGVIDLKCLDTRTEA